MRTFSVEILKGGKWRKVTAVFPFSSGELLDERLDEAYVTFYSRTKEYKPLTEFRITHYVDGVQDGDIEYYILATDNSAEFPSGSGRYKHQVYLIERTKLLEGVICPSITFTNATKDVYKEGRDSGYDFSIELPDEGWRARGVSPTSQRNYMTIYTRTAP